MKPFDLVALLRAIPPRYRRWVYPVIGAFLVLWGIYEAAGHDWRVAVGLLVPLLGSALASANVPSSGAPDGGPGGNG